MLNLLPEKYQGFNGKQKGIIDTGNTIEFWCRKIIIADKKLNLPSLREMILSIYCSARVGGKKTDGFCLSHWKHYVTLQRHPSLGEELGVFFHMDDCDVVPIVGKLKLPDKGFLLGVVPHNANMHLILKKKIEIIGQGRIHKIQKDIKLALPGSDGGNSNIKVILPYGPYKFDTRNNLVVNYNVSKQAGDRFESLMINEED